MKKENKFIDKHLNQIEPNKKIFHDYIVKEDAFLMDYLLNNVSGQSRNNIKSLLSNRQILVNGQTQTKFNYPLKAGDKIVISVNPDGHKTRTACPFQILYEDNNYLAINKPSGILSVNLDETDERNAYHLMNQYVKQINPKNSLFILHRIDKDTSGVLVFTKDLDITEELQSDWNSYVSIREYEAVCEGNFDKKEGTRISYLAEGKSKLMYSVRDESLGLKAITNYKVIKENKNYSLVRVDIETGRKNQIRVHMKELGHPVAGDKKYHSATDPLKRLCLHARTLKFFDPISKDDITIVAPTPLEFKKIVK